MSTIQDQIKGYIPSTVWNAARSTWYGIYRASKWPAATFHPWRRTSIQNLNRYKDAHLGERCFIIGNGPSLKMTDLSCLQNEFTFGMNRIYLLFPEMGFPTTYYLSINDLVIEQCVPDILSLQMPRFLSWRSREVINDALAGEGRDLPLDPPLSFLHTTYTGPKFAHDASQRLWEGATVTYVAMQLAFHMGFKKVILIGVDHSFSTKGKPNTTVVSQGEDTDHFDGNYFGKGFRWQLPDLQTSEAAYMMAKHNYLAANREILDATIDGKLTVFPKVKYSSLFD
ncbi:MAG: 6-hydroxymethylpterin diphosphokinase MptE-like protein [Anaerolineales bacterium]